MAAPPHKPAGSNLGVYVQALRERRQAIDLARKDQGKIFKNVYTRADLSFRLSNEGREQMRKKGPKEHLCYITDKYPPSSEEIEELRPITLTDLQMEKRHLGCVLFVRTFTDAGGLYPVTIGIEDQKGDVNRISVYNTYPYVSVRQEFPKGTVLAIKEPVYTRTDGDIAVRVDHPSDLVPIEGSAGQARLNFNVSTEILNRTADGWRAVALEKSAAKDFPAAVRALTGALTKTPMSDVLKKTGGLCRRAELNCGLRRPGAMLYDTTVACKLIEASRLSEETRAPVIATSYNLGALANYKLEEFDLAQRKLIASMRARPANNDECRRMLAKVNERLQEETTGKYNMGKLRQEGPRTHHRLDFANFTANVEIRHGANRGTTGVFAKSAMLPGEVILREKAFCVALDRDPWAKQCVSLNLNTGFIAPGLYSTLLASVVHKMYDLLDKANEILALSAGSGRNEPNKNADFVDQRVVVDSFRVAEILERNTFSCSAVSSADDLMGNVTGNVPGSSCGVWTTASHINHSCTGNAQFSFVGDMIIVRATKFIRCQEEILMPKLKPQLGEGGVPTIPPKFRGYACPCRICAADAKVSEDDRKRRQSLVKYSKLFLDARVKEGQVDSSVPMPMGIFSEAQKLLMSLDETYDKDLYAGLPRRELALLSSWLMHNCDKSKGKSSHTGEFNELLVVDLAKGVLKSLGYPIGYPDAYPDLNGPDTGKKGKAFVNPARRSTSNPFLADELMIYDDRIDQLGVEIPDRCLDIAAIDAIMTIADHSDDRSYYRSVAKRLYTTLLGELWGFEVRYPYLGALTEQWEIGANTREKIIEYVQITKAEGNPTGGEPATTGA